MDILINSVITTTLTAMGILLLKRIFTNRLSPRLNLYLWIILVVRMLVTFLPQSYLFEYNIIPIVNNVKIQEQTMGNIDDDYVTDQIEYMTGTINNYSEPFSTYKYIQNNFVIVWLAGTVLLLFYLMAVYIIFSIKLSKIETHNDEKIKILLGEYRTKMNIKADVSIKVYGSTPMLKGILKPVIILPEGYEINEIKQMIIHELCHLKHHDILLNAISTIILCLNWYNPIIWMCYSTFKSDLEVLCDYKVLEIVTSKKEYAALLVKTSFKSAPPLPMTTCMNNGKNQIKRRISFMAHFRKPNVLWTMIITISIVILSVGCLSSGVSSTDSDKWAPPFKGLQWGMSEAEVMEVLNFSEDDINKNSFGFVSKNELEFLGFRKSVKFVFGSSDALIGITVVFDEKELDKVEKKITERLGEGKYSYRYGESFLDKTLSSVSWESALLKEQQKNVDIIKNILENNESNNDNWLLERYMEKPLVCYILNRDNESSSYKQLEISGALIAMINEPDKFIR